MNHTFKKSFILLLALITMGGVAMARNVQKKNNLENCTKVSLETSMGKVVVALYNETPLHRDNFIKLVKENFYSGVLFHRVIKDFMVQCGDPDSKTAQPGTMLGGGDVGYTIPAEFVYPQCYHKRGALAAARTGDQVNPERRSSGCQFYIVAGKVYPESQLDSLENSLGQRMKRGIFMQYVQESMDSIRSMQESGDEKGLNNLETELIAKTEAEYATNPFHLTTDQRRDYSTMGGTPHLDSQYTVFGEVVEGMDVIDKIQNVATDSSDRPLEDIKIIKATIVQ